MKIIALVFVFFAFPVCAQEAAKPWTVDMTSVLTEGDGKPIRDCSTSWDAKTDPKRETCPTLKLSMAAAYAVEFPLESDRNADWRTRAGLRVALTKYGESLAAEITHKQADDLMDRIGALYKLLQSGDKVIVAAMKILQPNEFNKLGEK